MFYQEILRGKLAQGRPKLIPTLELPHTPEKKFPAHNSG